jgi:hypothetical protein
MASDERKRNSEANISRIKRPALRAHKARGKSQAQLLPVNEVRRI